MLPANHATLGPPNGSFTEIRSLNGKNPRAGDPFYGFTGNVR